MRDAKQIGTEKWYKPFNRVFILCCRELKIYTEKHVIIIIIVLMHLLYIKIAVLCVWYNYLCFTCTCRLMTRFFFSYFHTHGRERQWGWPISILKCLTGIKMMLFGCWTYWWVLRRKLIFIVVTLMVNYIVIV